MVVDATTMAVVIVDDGNITVVINCFFITVCGDVNEDE